MDDNSPTNTITITSRRDQTDITQLTTEPATQDWNSHAARHQDQDGGRLRRAPSKHGRAAHARRGHEHDAETRPRTRARPGKASTGTLYTQLSSLYTQKQHPHEAKQKHHYSPTKKAQRTKTDKQTTKQRLPWACFCDPAPSKKPDQQQTPAAARATRRPKPRRRPNQAQPNAKQRNDK